MRHIDFLTTFWSPEKYPTLKTKTEDKMSKKWTEALFTISN